MSKIFVLGYNKTGTKSLAKALEILGYKTTHTKGGGECSVQMYDNHLILRLSMTTNPFPHPKALKDMKKSYMYTDDAAKITLKLLDETGIINVGGEPQFVYEFVKKENPDIGFNYLSEISDVNMATDCSMNTTKLKKVINDTII